MRQQTKPNLYVSVETYLSPVETHCINIEYFLPDVDNQTKGFSEDAMTRLRKFPLQSYINILVKMENIQNHRGQRQGCVLEMAKGKASLQSKPRWSKFA